VLLGDWITRQQAEVASGAEGAGGRLTAGLHLLSELEKNDLHLLPGYEEGNARETVEKNEVTP